MFHFFSTVSTFFQMPLYSLPQSSIRNKKPAAVQDFSCTCYGISVRTLLLWSEVSFVIYTFINSFKINTFRLIPFSLFNLKGSIKNNKSIVQMKFIDTLFPLIIIKYLNATLGLIFIFQF